MLRDVNCVHCNTPFQIPDRSGLRDTFCPGCGALLPVSSLQQAGPPASGERRCRTCGEVVPPEMDRCRICGELLPTDFAFLPTSDLMTTPAGDQAWLICILTFLPLLGIVICPPMGFLPMPVFSTIAVTLAWNNLRAMAGGRIPSIRHRRWVILVAGVIAGLEVLATVLVFGAYFVNIFSK